MRLNFFSYIGGKFYLVDKLLKLIPSHETYIEPFGGSAKLLLNKPPSKVEIYNDADIRLANLFYVVSNEATFNEFYEKVNRLVYSRALLKELCECANTSPSFIGDVDKAVCFYYSMRASFSSGLGYGFAYSFTRNEASRFINSVKKLPIIHERLKNILTFNESYDIILEKYMNDEKVFVYLDPPYYGAEHYYKFFTEGDHERMLKLLKKAKFKWLLSGYDNNLYSKELKDFCKLELSSFKPSYGITKHSKHKKRPKSQEILWSNYYKGGDLL